MVVHENEWPWGKTVTFIIEGGIGTVDMSFEKNNPGVCYMSGLSVVFQMRKLGKGLRLVTEVIDYCKRNGIFRIDLNSVQEDWLMDFYHKLGFKDIEENDGFMRMYKILK